VLLCLSSNHRNATFELLEALAVGAPGAATGLVERGDLVLGAVVVATCNRFEAYLDIDEPVTGAEAVAVAAVLDVVGAASGVDVTELQHSIEVHTGARVAEHLFAVTSGLESVVVGEEEIAGQVSRALDRARAEGTTSRALERLFQRATRTSRGVRSATSVGGAERSVVRLALELASSRVNDWGAAFVLVIGTGRYAATTVAALRMRGAGSIAAFSPSGRVAAFAVKYGLRAETELVAAIARADVVIACTASTVIPAAAFAASYSRRLVIDLGLPRNVDRAVATLPGVELLDLETVRLHAPLEELSAHEDARALVAHAASTFAGDQAVEPAIVALRTHISALVDAEIERSRRRAASPEGAADTEAALRHLAGVLLHEPSTRARDLAAQGRASEFVAALGAVYGLDAELADRAADIDDASA
jgi:glutamyl-tRNA reductase